MYINNLNQVLEDLREEEPIFLEEAGWVNSEQSYVCPHCGNGSGNDRTGIVRNPRSGRYHCFVCDKEMDIVDLLMESEGITDFIEAVKRACDYCGMDYTEGSFEGEYKPMEKKHDYKPYDKTVDYSEYFKRVKEADNYEYLLSRGISIEVQKRFGVGYDALWRHPKSPGNVMTTPRCIIPTSNYSYLARDTREISELTDEQKKYSKMKVGSSHIFNIDACKTNRGFVFITEGEIDAMSLEEVGYPAIGLGTAGNADRLLDIWDDNYEFIEHVFIFGDNDGPGKAVTEYLSKEMRKRGSCGKTHVVKYPDNCNYKDPNDFLVNDRRWFEQFLRTVIEEEYLKHTIQIDDNTMYRLMEMERLCGLNLETEIANAVKRSFDEKKPEILNFYKSRMVKADDEQRTNANTYINANYTFYVLEIDSPEEKEVIKLLGFYEDARNPSILFNYTEKICCQLIQT